MQPSKQGQSSISRSAFLQQEIWPTSDYVFAVGFLLGGMCDKKLYKDVGRQQVHN